MYVILGSANRDETKFPNPDKFDILRKPEHRHLVFGLGPHICVGRHLAKLEITRAVDAILDRMPNLRLDPDKPPPVIRGSLLRMPRHLYVRYGD